MAPKDPDAEAEEQELSPEEKKRREEQIRQFLERLQAAQRQAQAGQAQAQTNSDAEYSGFVATEETQKRQLAEEAEKAQQGPQQPPHDDTFLKMLARVYGIQPQSFKEALVPVLMATTVVHAEQDKFLAGKFASGGQELPVVEITKSYCVSKGKMTPELAMQLAMLAAANPDMAKDGVEIKGKTEEDKLMLLAAAKLVGLMVKNEADIKIDSEQAMQQRAQLCRQGWANLQQWAAAGPTAPAPSQRPQSADKGANTSDAEAAAAAAAGAGAAEKLADGSPKPGSENKDADQPKAQKWADLSDKKKEALRTFFRDTSSRFDDLSDAELDQEIENVWDNLKDPRRQAALMRNAEAAAAARKPADEPAETSKPTFDGLRTDRQKNLVTEYLKSQHPEYDLTDEEWEKQAAEIWNRMKPEERSELFVKALQDEPRQEAESAKKKEAVQDSGTQPAPAPAGETGDGTATEAAPAKPILTAPPAPEPPAAPQLAPMNERKYGELLPKEKELLESDELAKRNAGKTKKEKKLSDDAQALLEGNWDHATPDERKARVEQIVDDPENAKTALLAEKERKAEQERLLAEHGKAIAKLEKAHDKAVKEFAHAMAAADPDAPPEAPALKPVEDRTFDQLLPAEQKALRKLAEGSGGDKAKAGEAWDGLSPDVRKERFEHATAGAANEKLRKEIERERRKAVKILNEANARAAAAATASAPQSPPPAAPAVETKTRPDADEDGSAQAPVVNPVDPPAPDSDAAAKQTPPPVAPPKDDGANQPAPAPAVVAPADTTVDKAPAAIDTDKKEVKPVKGTRSFDQLSQGEQDALWEFMTVTSPRPANPDGSAYSKAQLARTWNNIRTVAEQISTLDFVRKENAKAREAVADKKAERDDEHSLMVSKNFSQLLLAEQHLLEKDFEKRKPDGVASAEAEWNALDAKGKGDRMTLAELNNPDLGEYITRARRMDANQTRFIPRKFADLPPEEQKLLEADFEKRKPKDVASAQAEWDAMDDRRQDIHMDRAMDGNPEQTEAIFDARKKALEPKSDVDAQGPVATPAPAAPKPRSAVRELLSSVWRRINPWADQTPAPAPERKEPVLILPDAPVDMAGEAVIDDTPVPTPIAASPEIAGAAPGVEDASKKAFDDLLLQEKRILLVDAMARKGSVFGDELKEEWNGLDEAGRANLLNHAWQNQPQLRDRVVADQEAHTLPPAPEAELTPPVVDETEHRIMAEISTPPVAQPLKDISERSWSELLQPEKEAVRLGLDTTEADAESQWPNMSAGDRNTAIDLGTDGNDALKAQIAEARQQAAQPAAIEVSLPTAPPVAKETEQLEIPPETDTEFDAALQAHGRSRADLATMGVEAARDLIATIRKEQEQAREAAAQTPPAPPEPITPKFTNSVRNVFETPPDPAIMDKLHAANVTDEFYFKFRETIIKDRKVSAARVHNLGLSWDKAKVVIEALKEEGIVGEDPDTHRRFVLAERDGTLCTKNPPQAPPTPSVS